MMMMMVMKMVMMFEHYSPFSWKSIKARGNKNREKQKKNFPMEEKQVRVPGYVLVYKKTTGILLYTFTAVVPSTQGDGTTLRTNRLTSSIRWEQKQVKNKNK